MTILQALNDFYGRLEKRGEAGLPQPGYEPVRIGFVLEITAAGKPLELIDIRERSGKKPSAEKFLMPAIARTSGIKPAFLWDKTAYLFGLVATEGKDEEGKKLILPGQGKRTAKEHQAFVEAHREALQGQEDEGLKALLAFIESWSPEQWVERGFSNEALDQNIAFRLKGDAQWINQRPAARQFIAGQQEENDRFGICLVAGDSAALADKQPQFKGVLGAQSSGAPIVSFNSDAYESYGKSMGANAPVSERAAFRYGAALNWLLDRKNNRCLRLGEATLVYWADENEVGEEAANKVELAWGGMFEPSEDEKDIDKEQAHVMGVEIDKSATGRAAADRSKLDPATRLHILALSPNAGRIAVRFWLVDTFGHLEKNLRQHEQDLAIEPPAFGGKKPKAWALLYETAVQRKAENIPPRLGGELMQAILTGNRYPHSFLTAVIGRIRADHDINGPRAAILKAVINRNNRKNELTKEDIPVSLKEDSQDEAYNLGRLFAAYEYAESSAAKRNATIKDKYIGSASATPRRVFPILMRGFETNLSKLAKGDGNQRGSGVKVAKTVTQILDLFEGGQSFRTSLKLEEQARFFVGYYHQNAAMYVKKQTTDNEELSQ